MAEVKWIKIVTDIFDDEKILLIESMPEADSIIVIWFKLLVLAGKTNNKGVFLISDRIPYTEEMLATIFRRKINTVRLALQTFEQFGMIEIIDGVITIPNWGKHQTLDMIDKRREYQREYMQKYREKQKLIASKPNSKPNSKTNVNPLDIDIDKDKEEDIDIKNKDIYIVEQKPDNIPYEDIIIYLNAKCSTNYRYTTKKTKDLIKARFNEGFTYDDFKTVIDKKSNEWLNTDMAKYLRPETLFGNKFESYLNQQIKRTSKTMIDLDDVDIPF